MPTLTVFTPAYNRAHTLPRTYRSLCCQSCKDFIWLIVDDGSTDDTAELVKQWKRENSGFKIKYIYKENGGMHTAHNVAYANIDTELNICIDSDDELAEEAIKKILQKWEEVKNQGYAGIVGLDADMNSGEIIGTDFGVDQNDTTLAGFYMRGGRGDKKLVYRTDIINQYPPYPVFEGEKYVALAYKYRLIDQSYKLAVLNEVLCNVEYQKDGSSMNMFSQYVKSPRGFAFWRKVCMQYPESKKRMLMDCVHYCSSSMIAGNKQYIKESPQKLLTLLCTVPGIVLTMYIRWKVRALEYATDRR
uniref:glycosyltransferase family 2 protein n=1 Tax=Flavonifractor sp. An52 TaxID=1965642 RepID=UPI000B3A3086|nr:glycosyltransferase family 2 protein [Flavonifractor sp. An52]OUN79905.1 glycosyltransferase [Flavonifractor sp. An52]